MKLFGFIRNGSGFGYLFSIIKSRPGKFLLMVVCIVLGAFTNMLSVGSVIPLVQSFIDNSSGSNNLPGFLKRIFVYVNLEPNLINTAIIFLSLVVLASIFNCLRNIILEKLLINISVELRANLFSVFLKTNWSYLLATNNNEIQNALVEQISKIGKCIKIIAGVLAALFNIICYLILIISLAGIKTFFLVLILLFVPCIVLMIVVRISKRLGKKMVDVSSHMHQVIINSLNGLKFIKASALSDAFLINFHDKAFNFGQAQFKSLLIGHVIVFLEEPVKMVGVLGVILLLHYYTPGLEVSSLVALGILLQRCYMLVSSNVATLQELATSISAAELCGRITKESFVNYEKSGSVSFDELKDAIVFNDASFCYNDAQPILDNVCFSIPKGKTTALLGVSGSGKTTIVDLILGLNKLSSGSLLINGTDIIDINLEQYRSKIGYVPQDSYIINGSIRDNLLLGNGGKSEDDIWSALLKAHAAEYVANAEDGLDTIVGDGGLRLSGGQKQRLALARALLREPQILILDEATSALDVSAEKIVQQAIEDLGHCITIIVIAHRLNTVKNADVFLEVNEGKVFYTDYATFVDKVQGINIK